MQLRPLTLFGIIMSMVTGVVLGVSAFWILERHLPDASGTDDAAALAAVVAQVQNAYVEPIPEGRLVENAIRGIMRGLDDHSAFLNAEELGHLQEETTGKFGGIGIEVGLVDGYVTVVAPLDDTPAAVAGLRAGDTIVELDHETLKGRTLTQTVAALRGEPGTNVHLRVLRDGADAPIEFALVRATIQVNSVRWRLIEPGYGYLRISQFQNTTADDVHNAVQQLIDQTLPSELLGLIIDLRNNPGGVLRASVAVADTFLDNGLIVYTEGRMPSSVLRFNATGEDMLNGAPLVVLINRGSASASEIVAGALQDHGRAVLVGTKSYGKGSVQSVLPLRNKQAIKLTTARYYTPSGRSIQASGIEPDVTVPAENVVTPHAYTELLLAEALRQLKQG